MLVRLHAQEHPLQSCLCIKRLVLKTRKFRVLCVEVLSPGGLVVVIKLVTQHELLEVGAHGHPERRGGTLSLLPEVRRHPSLDGHIRTDVLATLPTGDGGHTLIVSLGRSRTGMRCGVSRVIGAKSGENAKPLVVAEQTRVHAYELVSREVGQYWLACIAVADPLSCPGCLMRRGDVCAAEGAGRVVESQQVDPPARPRTTHRSHGRGKAVVCARCVATHRRKGRQRGRARENAFALCSLSRLVQATDHVDGRQRALWALRRRPPVRPAEVNRVWAGKEGLSRRVARRCQSRN